MPYFKNHWLKEANRKLETTPEEARTAMEEWFQNKHSSVASHMISKRTFYDIHPQYLQHDLALEVRNTPQGIKVAIKDYDWNKAAKLAGTLSKISNK